MFVRLFVAQRYGGVHVAVLRVARRQIRHVAGDRLGAGPAPCPPGGGSGSAPVGRQHREDAVALVPAEALQLPLQPLVVDVVEADARADGGRTREALRVVAEPQPAGERRVGAAAAMAAHAEDDERDDEHAGDDAEHAAERELRGGRARGLRADPAGHERRHVGTRPRWAARPLVVGVHAHVVCLLGLQMG